MQILPKFVTPDGAEYRLPMADRSASALVRAWSQGDPFSLATAMSQDPPLAVWAAQAYAATGVLPPTGGLLFLAGWLCRRGKASLANKTVGEATLEPPTRERVLAAAELAARGRLIGELAARLAEELPGEARPKDRIRLLALLSQRKDWMAWSGESQPADLEKAPADEAIPEFVHQACAIVAGTGAAPESWNLSKSAIEARTAEYAREWIAPSLDGSCETFFVGHVPEFCWEVLADKLEDADLLYDRFDQHVEREKLEAMAEFAAGAGHEINNPLAIISGRAQLLLRDEKDPERRRELSAIHAQAVRVYEMIADMMLFARPPAPRKETLDVAKLLESLRAELTPLASDRQIEVLVVETTGPIEIEADSTQLQVALRAMGDNALEAMGSKGKLEFSARRLNGTEIEIVVRDNGPGITDEIRRHLFDPYYSGRQAGRGLGLGLSKAWRIVTNHGGTIEVESQPASGARFAIRLPAGK